MGNNMKTPFFAVRRNMVLTAIFYTFLWGSAFPLVKMCMTAFGIADGDQIAKCLLAGVRFSLSGVLTLTYCAVTEKSIRLSARDLRFVIPYGILATAMQYAFTYIGLSRIDGSKGAVFDQLCVFVIVLLGGLFFKSDRLTGRKILGCLLGFAGVLIINTDGLGFSFSLGGEGMMLLSVVSQTAAYFVAKGAAGKLSAAKLVGYGQLLGGLFLCVGTLCLGGGFKVEDGVTAAWTLVCLVLISAVAYVLSLMPLKYFDASEVSSFNLLITVFGVVMSAVVLKENIFRWNIGASLALIILGILCINRKSRKQ